MAEDSFDPEAPEEREVGREMVDKSTGLGSVMAHFYRGEVDRMNTWRQRLDQTTKWVVTLLAAFLTWTFSSPENPHYILLIGMVIVGVFLGFETRRYRAYDIWRSRVRTLQENLFANALDPSQGVEQTDWRARLSADFHHPVPKLSTWQALAHRLRRVYLPLLCILLAAWFVRISVFAPQERWLETAAVGSISGTAVVAVVTLVYFCLLVAALAPGLEHIRGEFYEVEMEELEQSVEER